MAVVVMVAFNFDQEGGKKRKKANQTREELLKVLEGMKGGNKKAKTGGKKQDVEAGGSDSDVEEEGESEVED